jgi:UDP-N-acetylglucosamine kinase
MNPEELKIKENAEEHARSIKKIIAKELSSQYASESNPVSVFMAGSPGAGKTESSKWLIEQLTGKSDSILRIDPDELRSHFNEYNGKNSNLFQGATSILAEKIHDIAIDQSKSFIFDATFSKIEKARQNIERSINHSRPVQIIYVYQDPLQAWEFVKARELKDGRHVPKDSFVEEYFNARNVVNQMKKEFPKIVLYLLVKNIDGTTQEYKENIDNIDNYVKEDYTVDTLKNMLL